MVAVDPCKLCIARAGPTDRMVGQSANLAIDIGNEAGKFRRLAYDDLGRRS